MLKKLLDIELETIKAIFFSVGIVNPSGCKLEACNHMFRKSITPDMFSAS